MMPPKIRTHPLAPLLQPMLLLGGMFVFGSVGFYMLGWGAYSPLDCIYMTAISLTTVGYGDTLHVSDTPIGRVYVIFLLVVGMGVTLYSVSSVTAFIVEGHLRRLFRERAMQKKINNLSQHYLLCGVGETGIHVLRELLASDVPYVIVDGNEQAIARVSQELGIEPLTVIGDATEERVLEAAGIQRAAGLVAVLTEDKDNLFLVVTASFMNPSLRIVAKCLDHNSTAKFRRAGASYVVSPTFIGGMRIASQLLRPNVVTFLDNMLRGKDKSVRVDEVEVPPGGVAEGKSLRELRIAEHTGMLVIAVRDAGSLDFDYNPGGDRVLTAGSLLVVIGRGKQAEKLRHLVGDGRL